MRAPRLRARALSPPLPRTCSRRRDGAHLRAETRRDEAAAAGQASLGAALPSHSAQPPPAPRRHHLPAPLGPGSAGGTGLAGCGKGALPAPPRNPAGMGVAASPAQGGPEGGPGVQPPARASRRNPGLREGRRPCSPRLPQGWWSAPCCAAGCSNPLGSKGPASGRQHPPPPNLIVGSNSFLPPHVPGGQPLSRLARASSQDAPGVRLSKRPGAPRSPSPAANS